MPTLSVTVLTLNEAKDIRRCLASVSWADEIIVLDCGSTDGTQAICREYTDKCLETDWPGFGIQHNRALKEATGDWVLSLDADEYGSDALHDAIKTAMTDDTYAGYEIRFQSKYCGKILKHGASSAERHHRLFRRDCVHYTDSVVHEQSIINGKIGLIDAPIYHESFKDLDEVLMKINRYSTIGAEDRLQRGKKGSLKKAIGRGIWAFIKSYFFQRHFLNGREGFMLSVSNAEGTYYRYLKLMYLRTSIIPAQTGIQKANSRD